MPTDPPVPPTRSQRQQATREALVLAALAAFTRDGYHGANLESIAHEAGFSKGAVYSNFASKADLFLAVMDRNVATLGGEGWDLFAPADPDGPRDEASDDRRYDGGNATEALRGFALASLEFIATAARDAQLEEALRERIRALLTAYTRVADRGRASAEVLPVEQVGTLLAGLDQGIALLAILGIETIDGQLLRTGLQRLVDPARAAEAGPADAPPGPPPIHDVEFQRRVLRDLAD